MNNLQYANKMAMMGWMPIPALPGKKQTYYEWKLLNKNNYDFKSIFYPEPGVRYVNDVNVAILMDDIVCCVDLDAHDPEPNGRTIFDKLDPSVYEGCIIELSQSGGAHIYYRGLSGINRHSVWAPGYDYYYYDKDGLPVIDMYNAARPAILAGRTISYCYPTTTENGQYEIVSDENYLNTRPWELPPLHPLWTMINPYMMEKPAKTAYKSSRKYPVRTPTPAQIEYSIKAAKGYDYNVRSDARHDRAIAFCCEILSLGVSNAEAVRHVNDYIRMRRPLERPSEGEEIVKWCIESGEISSEPIMRWKAVREQEKVNVRNRIKRLMGGD